MRPPDYSDKAKVKQLFKNWRCGVEVGLQELVMLFFFLSAYISKTCTSYVIPRNSSITGKEHQLILTEEEHKLNSHSACSYQPFPRKVSLYHFPDWILELKDSDVFVT